MKESLFLFDVYDNTTDKLVYTGTYDEVEDYIENPGRYTVVWQINGGSNAKTIIKGIMK